MIAINLTPFALLFTIASIGISESAYLIRKRIAAERPVCPLGGDCVTVLSSKYNRMFLGIHNDPTGMAFYIFFAVVSALLVLDAPHAALLLFLAKLALVVSTLMSLILIFIQGRVIKSWCFWCLMSAATIFLMDIIILTI